MMVSNSVVVRPRVRWPVRARTTTPVLQYMSPGRWRLFAVVVEAGCGGASHVFYTQVNYELAEAALPASTLVR